MAFFSNLAIDLFYYLGFANCLFCYMGFAIWPSFLDNKRAMIWKKVKDVERGGTCALYSSAVKPRQYQPSPIYGVLLPAFFDI